MPRNMINDGFTRKGHLDPIKGIHEGMSFSYRPMLVEEVDQVDDAMRTRSVAVASQVIRTAVAKHVVDWDEVDKDGQPVKIEAQNVRLLPWQLHQKLYKIISGQEAGDLPEGADDDMKSDYVQSLLNGVTTPEDDAKNSNPG